MAQQGDKKRRDKQTESRNVKRQTGKYKRDDMDRKIDIQVIDTYGGDMRKGGERDR